MQVFVVTEFGCNSGYNDMYPPKVQVFGTKEKAMECYLKLKNEIIKMKEHCNIYERENYECIIQKGGGVMFNKETVQEMKPTFRGAW
jgi:hypothetical protein